VSCPPPCSLAAPGTCHLSSKVDDCAERQFHKLNDYNSLTWHLLWHVFCTSLLSDIQGLRG
jgi:hypothetical protein